MSEPILLRIKLKENIVDEQMETFQQSFDNRTHMSGVGYRILSQSPLIIEASTTSGMRQSSRASSMWDPSAPAWMTASRSRRGNHSTGRG